VAEFYAKVFGWQTKQLGPEMGDYLLATTAESDEKGMSKIPGTINGGFYKKSKPEQGTNVVIQVDDIREALRKVKEAGGTVLGGMASKTEPDNIPGVGLFASIIDTEGNHVSLMQLHKI
jgi:predicted enzyme related to lactoylglutathione lyase